jgi:hypothetical protein
MSSHQKVFPVVSAMAAAGGRFCSIGLRHHADKAAMLGFMADFYARQGKEPPSYEEALRLVLAVPGIDLREDGQFEFSTGTLLKLAEAINALASQP